MTGATKTPESELKRLLLARELDLLYELNDRVEQVEDRVGSDGALRDSVHRIFVEVLQRANVSDHERIARTLAPLVLSSIREEIRNSRDMLVDALYPITGRLVAAAVRNAFLRLIETLNDRLDRSVSFNRLYNRLRAKITGRSEADILLLQNPPFDIADLLVIHRPTGLLISRVADDSVSMAVDSDLMAGMLTAIMAFTRDAFGSASDGELSRLTFGDAELHLMTSPAVILAVATRGPAPVTLGAALQDEFVDLIDRWGETLRDFTGSLLDFQQRALETDLRNSFRQLLQRKVEVARPPPYKALAVLAVVLVLALGWGGYAAYRDYRTEALVRVAASSLASDPTLIGYPLDVAYDAERPAVTVTGLFPDSDSRLRAQEKLAAALGDVPIEFRASVLPRGGGDGTAAPRIAALETAVATGLAEIDIRAEALERRFDETRTAATGRSALIAALETALTDRLAETEGRLDALAMADAALVAEDAALRDALVRGLDEIKAVDAALEARTAALEATVDDPTATLWRFMAGNAVFFAEIADYRDPAAAEATLSELAALIAAAPEGLGVRVVGYSDEIGTTRTNSLISFDRAKTVADRLTMLGVAPERLLVIGRGASKPLSGDVGVESGNRRVEFEAVLIGELVGR